MLWPRFHRCAKSCANDQSYQISLHYIQIIIIIFIILTLDVYDDLEYRARSVQEYGSSRRLRPERRKGAVKHEDVQQDHKATGKDGLEAARYPRCKAK